MRYGLRRFTHAILVLVLVSFVTFCVAALAPGRYFDDARLNPQISSATLQSLYIQHGRDLPLLTQYSRWLRSVAKGDLGFSLTYNMAVRRLLFKRIGNTLLLTLTAAVVSCGLALVIGTWSSQNRGRRSEGFVGSVLTVLTAVPDAALAVLLLLFALRTGWFPLGGMTGLEAERASIWQGFFDLSRHLVLPAAVLVLSTLPFMTRHVHAAMCEVSELSYIRAAEAFGIRRIRLLSRYLLRAAAAPLLSIAGLMIGSLLSCSLLVEIVMSWPGLGSLLFESVLARDLDVVVAGVLVSTGCLVLGNFLADMALYANDPRIRPERRLS